MGLNSYTLVIGREVNRRLFLKKKTGGVAMKEVCSWGNRTAMLANLKSSVSLFSLLMMKGQRLYCMAVFLHRALQAEQWLLVLSSLFSCICPTIGSPTCLDLFFMHTRA
jgi:hypothetical protein